MAYSRWENGCTNIYLMDVETGINELLTDAGLGAYCHNDQPTWSPDGTRLAFVTRPKGGRSSIFVANVDGTGGYSLVNDDYIDQAPAWSPDGTQLAFVSYRAARLPGGEPGYPGTFIMDADDTAGTTIRQVGDVFDVEPDWSPDGTQLAVSNTAWTGGLLRLIDVSTGVGTSLENAVFGQHPSWSSDGEHLLYHLFDAETNASKLWVTKNDGSEKSPLNGTEGGFLAKWSYQLHVDRCYGTPFIRPEEGRNVRINRNYPLTDSSLKVVNGVPVSIPIGAEIIVTHKAVNDLSVWYYIEGYIDPVTGEEVTIVDTDGLSGDADGNWIFQRNLLGEREADGSTNAYCGLALATQDGGFADLNERCEPLPEFTLTEACQSLPWAEEPDCYGGNLEGEICVYEYNRDDAALYATTYAGLPNPNALPGSHSQEDSTLFCTYNYGGAHTNCAPTERPLPPKDPNTSEIRCERDEAGNCLFPTDCANFTSNAMWYGGLPMVERWFCEGEPCLMGGTSENYSWTYAGTTGQPEYLQGVLAQYDPETSGRIVPFVPIDTAAVTSYLDPYADRPQVVAMQRLADIWGAFESGSTGQVIANGDIVWASLENREHMMMVVGWGPMLITWEEIDAFWDANTKPDGSYDFSVLTTVYPDEMYNFHYNPHPDFGYVPYLVDHGLHGMAEHGPLGPDDTPVLVCPSCILPRPYYALYWNRVVTGFWGVYTLQNLVKDLNAPKFIHIPDEFMVPLEEVKAPPIDRESISDEILEVLQ